jgi:hypothetical protein
VCCNVHVLCVPALDCESQSGCCCVLTFALHVCVLNSSEDPSLAASSHMARLVFVRPFGCTLAQMHVQLYLVVPSTADVLVVRSSSSMVCFETQHVLCNLTCDGVYNLADTCLRCCLCAVEGRNVPDGVCL